MSPVFSGDSFPSVDLWEWSLGQALLGEFKVITRYYDANHKLVDKPSKPGRYGAVVDIESPHAPTERGLELGRALRKRHGRVRFTLYHAVGHDSGTPAYQGDQLYTWFLEQRRGHPKQARSTRTDTKPND